MLLVLLTFLIFFTSVKWNQYYFCYSYGCISFFFQHFSVLFKAIGIEGAVISFTIALAKLDNASESLQANLESNDISRRLMQYEMFDRILEVHHGRDEILLDVPISAPILFAAVERFSSSLVDSEPFASLSRAITEENDVHQSSGDQWDAAYHQKKITRILATLGIFISELGDDDFLTLESAAILFLEDLASLFIRTSGIGTTPPISYRLPRPVYFPPHIVHKPKTDSRSV